MAVQLSTRPHLTRLPLEILEPIFFQSGNPSLPLCSRFLLSSLPPTQRSKEIIAISMLASRDKGIQTNLLARRFMDLEFYEALIEYFALTYEIACRSINQYSDEICPLHIVLVPGVELSPRLFQNLESNPWKRKLISYLIYGGANGVPHVRNLIKSNNETAIEFLFQGPGLGLAAIDSVVKLLIVAVVQQGCASKDIVWMLFCLFHRKVQQKSNAWKNPILYQWIRKRATADERIRERHLSRNFTHPDWIVGEWVASCYDPWNDGATHFDEFSQQWTPHSPSSRLLYFSTTAGPSVLRFKDTH